MSGASNGGGIRTRDRGSVRYEMKPFIPIWVYPIFAAEIIIGIIWRLWF